ncbi:MAG: cytochrome C peroxidase [Haliscomenobacter sp.]|nr:cytochrome C peroxidase [Haliscomenobacter sp.]
MNHSRTIAFGILGLLAFSLAAVSCEPDTPGTDCTDCTTDDRITATYDPKPYAFNLPSWFPAPIILPDNPLTVDGVELGRHLFYDPILSVDSTLACASCHRQEKSFANDRPVNTGVLGLPGKRNAMALINLAYNPRGFFWDGRAASPEEIAFVTIEDHLENNDTWDNVERKLRKHKSYPQLFRKAFGIERTSEITRDLASKAMGQFVRTLVSAQARYDRVLWARQGFPTDSEQRGISLFFIEDDQTVEHPGCSHCHFNPFFSDHNFRNNGLDSAATLDQFPDLGRGAISKNQYDNGRFKVPSLRNIELTAPYMHDGRFKTLEEVLNHYSSGGHPAANVDPNILKFTLTDQDKADLIAFLKMLTDTAFVNNPAFGKPL